MRHIIDVMELLEGAEITASEVKDFLLSRGIEESEITFEEIREEKGSTLFIKIILQGSSRVAPTLGIIGRLGGMGARPHAVGFVSDADGAIAALASAAKLGVMRKKPQFGCGLPTCPSSTLTACKASRYRSSKANQAISSSSAVTN